MGHKNTIKKIKPGSSNVTFDEVAKLLQSLGYKKNNNGKTSGSRIKFINIATGKIIYLHRPHPRKTLLQYQVKAILDVNGDEI